MKKVDIFEKILKTARYSTDPKNRHWCSCMVALPAEVIIWLFYEVLDENERIKLKERIRLSSKERIEQHAKEIKENDQKWFGGENYNVVISLFDVIKGGESESEWCIELEKFLQIIDDVCNK